MTDATISITAPLAALPPASLDSLRALTGAGLRDVLGERVRQIDVEQFTLEHDLGHHPGELALAAASYLNFAVDQLHRRDSQDGRPDPATWPWQREAWRPGDARANAVKAGALVLALLDRLDHAPRDSGEALPPIIHQA